MKISTTKTYYFCTNGHRKKCKNETEANKLYEKYKHIEPCKVLCVVEKTKYEQLDMFKRGD